MTWLLGLLTTIWQAAGDFLRGIVRDRTAISDAEEKGQAEAEAEGLKEIAEIADRQTQRATDDLSDDDVLKRLEGGTG